MTKGGYGVGLKDKNEMALAKFFHVKFFKL